MKLIIKLNTIILAKVIVVVMVYVISIKNHQAYGCLGSLHEAD